jgi:hypothetical protein
MTNEQVVDLARNFAREQGYDVARYDTRSIRKGHDWHVEFRPRDPKPRPGDFFSVHVNEQAPSMMRLVPGK